MLPSTASHQTSLFTVVVVDVDAVPSLCEKTQSIIIDGNEFLRDSMTAFVVVDALSSAFESFLFPSVGFFDDAGNAYFENSANRIIVS
jgi:hypothetical protein